MTSTDPTVSTADSSSLSPPSGTKTTTNRCLPGVNGPPEDCDVNGPPANAYPVLQYEGYTFWPLSYDDNDFAFAIVITPTGSTNVLGQFKAPGARYIESIDVYTGNQSVNFWGQAFAASAVSWADLASQAASVGGSSSGGSSSSAAGSSTSAASQTAKVSSSSTGTGTGTAATTTSSTTPGSGSSGSNPLSGGAIAGIVIGGIIGLFLISAIVAYFASNRVRKWVNDKFGEEGEAEKKPGGSGKPDPPKPAPAGQPGPGDP